MKLHRFSGAAFAAACISTCLSAVAQGPAARLKAPISMDSQVTLQGSRPPRALPQEDIGALPSGTPINGITLVFKRTDAQESALQTLLAAQQNPASPQYHQWLTPAQFGAQFGVADSDIAAVESWLQGEGFSVVGLSPAHDRITFSGTAAQVNAAFGTEIHQYQSGSSINYAPSTNLSLPAALAPMVLAVTHLNTFRPHPMNKRLPAGFTPAYTTSGTEEHFLTPKDVGTMYDVNPLYNSGYTGAGQTVAIAGETYIPLSDVTNFETALSLPANLPTLVLEPNTGASATFEGDWFESDLDVEYATSMAPQANVLLVYVGDSPNYGALDAFDYIIEEDLAPVASVSYGGCEYGVGSTYADAGDALFEQGAAQGQTLIASAGDEGSTECYGITDSNGDPEPAAIQEQLNINYPADSPHVTAIGGTQMAAGTFAAGSSQYWASAGSTAVVDSLLSYVPEVVWNEDSTSFGLASGGGGTSTIFSVPSWQTGVPGIPSGNTMRLNPDISLQASVISPGYIACSSDPSAFLTGQTTSCTNGVYDSTGKYVTEAGGTSFGAPIFAGLMAILNQRIPQAAKPGQGLINPTLYSLAANSTTYASAFHDITSGNNDCATLAVECGGSGLSEYSATTGYDEATGLGSIDFANLVAAWPAGTGSGLASTTTTLAPASSTPASGASDVITITVASSSGTPTGTVQVYLANNQTPVLTSTLSTNPAPTLAATLTLSNGQATYTFPGTTTGGTQIITATYTGDSTHASSTSTIGLTLANTLIPVGSFTFTVAGAITVPANNYSTVGLTLTPSGGYQGVVNFTMPNLPSADCFEVLEPVGNSYEYPVIASTTPVTLLLVIANGSDCSSDASVRIGNQSITLHKQTAGNVPPKRPWDGKPFVPVFAGLLAAGFAFRRRSRRLPMLLAVVFLTALGLGLSGCGGGTGTTTTGGGGGGTTSASYSLVGTDSVVSTITYSSTVTATIE